MARLDELIGVFDPEDIPDSYLPEGEYLCEIIHDEWIAAKSGNGKFLALTLKITNSETGISINLIERLNLINKNRTAEIIAARTLASICKACGKGRISDSEDLHFIKMKCKLGVSESPFGKQNFVIAYLPAEGTNTVIKPANLPEPNNKPSW